MPRSLLLLLGAALLAGCPPSEDPPPCAPAELQDENGACVPAECGAEPFGPSPMQGPTVFVARWGEDDAPGTRQAPLARIRDGVSALEEGGTVRVDAGLYREALDLGPGDDGVTIEGRCAALTTVQARDEDGLYDEPTFLLRGQDLTLRTLTVQGGARGIFVPRQFGPEVSVLLDGVVIQDSVRLGLALIGDEVVVEARDLVVRDTQTDGDEFGRGVNIELDARLIATNILIQRNHGVGVSVAGGHAELRGGRIEDTLPNASTEGSALVALQGGTLLAEDLVLRGNGGDGIFVSGGAEASLSDISVLEQVCRGDRPCDGLAVTLGATVEASGLRIEDALFCGVEVRDAGSRLVLRDSVIRGTVRRDEFAQAAGIHLWTGASLEATDLILEDNQGAGISVHGDGTRATLTGGVIRRVLPIADAPDLDIYGVLVQQGGSLSTDGLLLEELVGSAITISDSGSTGTMLGGELRDSEGPLLSAQTAGRLDVTGLFAHDLRGAPFRYSTDSQGTLAEITIQDVGGLESMNGAAALGVRTGAQVVATGFRAEGMEGLGVFVTGTGTSLTLTDSSVRDVLPDLRGTGGAGLVIQDGASLIATDVTVRRARQWGAYVDGSTAELLRLELSETLPLSSGRGGGGLGVGQGAVVLGTDLLLEDNPEGFLAQGAGTQVTLKGLTVRRSGTHGDSPWGLGLVVQTGAEVTGSDLLIEDNGGPGLYVAGGTLQVGSVRLLRNRFAGAVAAFGVLELSDGEVRGNTTHPTEGGGVGIYAFDAQSIGLMQVELRGLEFADHAGPALYVRGPGRYVLADSEVTSGGSPPWLPAAVLAVRGVPAWDGEQGLVLSGNRLGALPSAVLLDDAALTLALDDATGLGNTWAPGAPLRAQRCSLADPVQILDGSLLSAPCAEVPLPLGPILEYRLYVGETGLLE